MPAAPFNTRRGINTVMLVGTLAGCSTWRVQPVTPEQLLQAQRPKAVRVQRTDQSRVVLRNPRLAQDSLVGEQRGRPSAVALTDITQVAVRRGDALKTGGLVLGIMVAPFALLGIACALGADCNFSVN